MQFSAVHCSTVHYSIADNFIKMQYLLLKAVQQANIVTYCVLWGSEESQVKISLQLSNIYCFESILQPVS